MTPIELQTRMRQFSVEIINIETLCKSRYHLHHLFTQLIRSATSASLNYAEARAAESKQDYIHKMRLVLKELKESKENLAIVMQTAESDDLLAKTAVLYNESDQLSAIIAKSIQTAQKNLSIDGNRKSTLGNP